VFSSKFCVEAITTEALKDSAKYLVKTRKRKRWGGDRKSMKCIAMEFATKDVKGAKSVDDSMMRVSAMLARWPVMQDTLRRGAYQGQEILRSAPENWPIGFGTVLASLV
jgi:hypothetical protein